MISSSKPFAEIRADYAFYQEHSTEAAADLQAYVARLHMLNRTNLPVRMLDFGCGDGEFTAKLLAQATFDDSQLRVCLVEPDDLYRSHARTRVQKFSRHPIEAWPVLPEGAGTFDFILANHVFYYVPEIDVTVRAVLRALSPNGLFVTAMAGRRNTLIQFWERCFVLIDKPVPFHTAEDLARTLTGLGVMYELTDVPYQLTFPDAEENRLRMLRFLFGSYFQLMPRAAMLGLFDPFSDSRMVTMQLVHVHFTIDRRHGFVLSQSSQRTPRIEDI